MGEWAQPPICLAGARFQRIRRCGKLCRNVPVEVGAYGMRFATAAACALILRCLSVLSGATLLFTIAIAPVAAQQGDLNAIFRRFSEFYDAGNYPAALIEAQRYEAAIKARFGVNHANYGTALNNLANVYEEQGKYADAEETHKRALAIREKALGQNHSDVAQSLYNLARVSQGEGKYGEAERLYKRALAIREKALGAGHPDVAQTVNDLGMVYSKQGKYAEAEGLHKRALAIR